MAIKLQRQYNEYIGLSTDVKPIGVIIGSIFYERDTKNKYVTYDGDNWVLFIEKSTITASENVSSEVSMITLYIEDADTEYSVVLPDQTKFFRFKVRNPQIQDFIYFSFIPNTVGLVKVEPYQRYYQTVIYESANLFTTGGFTLYFSSNRANTTVELELWK